MIILNEQIVQFDHFHDGSCKFKCIPPRFQHATVVWKYSGNDEEILQAFYLLSHLRTHKCYIKLIMPYVINGRQDRCPHNDDIFTLKYFCNLLNSLQLDEVHVFDPHSSVTSALLNNVIVHTPEQILLDLLGRILPQTVYIAYPDTGAEHRYSAMLRLPFITGCKERDWNSGQLRKMHIVGETQDIAGRPFLVIDDIISRGSTIYEFSKCLKEFGASDIYVYASHLIAYIVVIMKKLK